MIAEKFDKEVSRLREQLINIEENWDAKNCIVEMKDNGYPHWRQMEWIGFYFQYRCEKELQTTGMIYQSPTYGRSSFDGLLKYPWDFKAHPLFDKNLRPITKLITNDSEATANAVQTYGAVGLILASGIAIYNDEDGTFKAWHEKIKGGKSSYEIERIQRSAPSRRRKTSFKLKKIEFIKITDTTLLRAGSFQEDFRNSNGNPRRPKVLLDLVNLPRNEIIDEINFS